MPIVFKHALVLQLFYTFSKTSKFHNIPHKKFTGFDVESIDAASSDWNHECILLRLIVFLVVQYIKGSHLKFNMVPINACYLHQITHFVVSFKFNISIEFVILMIQYYI